MKRPRSELRGRFTFYGLPAERAALPSVSLQLE